MNIYKLSMKEKCECQKQVAACIGYFDGLHKGHRGLVDATVKMAERLGCESGLITFDPDPWVTVKGIREIKHISTMQQRQKLAAEMGIENFFILDFTQEMASLSPEDFMTFIMEQLELKGLVCGFDFHYGSKGKGNTEHLREFSKNRFEFEQVNSINDENEKISSSRIFKCIESGKMKEANRLLGYPYTVFGTVIHGNAKGSSRLGFPTANCDIDSEFVLPCKGVYIGKVRVRGQERPSMINIGYNPTFNKRHMISIEAHILNFKEDIYDEFIEVEFHDYIREEKQFDSIEALIEQLNKDVAATAAYFKYE